MVRVQRGDYGEAAVFFRGARWQTGHAPSFLSEQPRSSLAAAPFDEELSWEGGDYYGTAALDQQHQQQQQEQQQADSSGLYVVSNEAGSGGAATAAAASLSGAGAFAAAEAAGSFLEVLSSSDMCAASAGSTGLRVRELLGWLALGVLALKLLLRRDKARRPGKVLVLDFLSTAAAWQLLELLPPLEPPFSAKSVTAGREREGADDACDLYAASLLIEGLLWLFILKLLLRQAEALFGYRQGEYLKDWRRSCGCSCRVGSSDEAAAGVLKGKSCGGGSRCETECLAEKFHGIDWRKYLQQLGVLLLCVTAAQLVTLLLLWMLAAPLATVVAVPLWMLHRDRASLRRFIVAFACPMCTDLVQFCSLDALIRRRPPPEPHKESFRLLADHWQK